MVKSHALYKKIAIATLIVAPFLSEFAARQTPHAPVEPDTATVVAAPASSAPAPAPASARIVPLSPSTSVMAGPVDPTPSLDPSVPGANGPGGAMAIQPASVSLDPDRPSGVSADGPPGSADAPPAPWPPTVSR